MLKIGLTGGIGSGKTLVGSVFQELGVPVYEADKEARRLMESDATVIAGVKGLFGEAAYAGGTLNRSYLADKVFGDDDLLTRLNDIVHPAVRKDFDRWTRRHATHAYVMEEAAILFESGGAAAMDFTVFVKAEASVRINRVMERDQVTEAEVRKRMERQMNDQQKELLSDFVIYNDNDRMILPQIVDLHNKFSKLNR
ncbi:MAG: dephospho-CoA kinase [Bacteroidales bacterium]|nr:dephospho-CoA kinase [Bacteroidales bacterium]MDT8430506.1 dephospho-CoA kinase [Bacteroidales bacterium]